jgi:hypothetical protein
MSAITVLELSSRLSCSKYSAPDPLTFVDAPSLAVLRHAMITLGIRKNLVGFLVLRRRATWVCYQKNDTSNCIISQKSHTVS